MSLTGAFMLSQLYLSPSSTVFHAAIRRATYELQGAITERHRGHYGHNLLESPHSRIRPRIPNQWPQYSILTLESL